MTLDEALDKIDVGQSIEQTVWTPNPGGDITPEAGVEYQVKLTVTKEEGGLHSISQQTLTQRQKGQYGT